MTLSKRHDMAIVVARDLPEAWYDCIKGIMDFGYEYLITKGREEVVMKVNFRGEMVEATEVEVLSSSERWNEYQLADGKVLMFKEVLVSVFKVEGKTNPDGSQAYQFQTHKVTRLK